MIIKSYFERYSSNSLAGSSNQYFFTLKKGEVKTGRVFYKIFCEGEYNYSFLFSNILDSTYADGEKSHCNLLCREWKIWGARVGVAQIPASNKEVTKLVLSEVDLAKSDISVFCWQTVLFNGKKEKEVQIGEVFVSDPLTLRFKKGEYLCVELTYSGQMIPYHEEITLPTFVKSDFEWKYSRCMPIPNMIGCDRNVRKKIGFLGDSITQGIGVKGNSYLHWNALFAEQLGTDYAFWNLGIGYGRAGDVASDGIWLKKAMQNDVVVVCLGVNDLCQGGNAMQIKANLEFIAQSLKEAGKKVVMQTVPPFNYNEKIRKEWMEVNRFIIEELSKKVDFLFDVVPILQESDSAPHVAKFGGHPNKEGNALWAQALYKKWKVKKF